MNVVRATPAPIVGALSWLTASAAVWLAITDQPWSCTLLVAAVGGLFLLFPPSGALPRSLLALLGLLLLLAATAFLPASWTGDAALRQPFLDHGIILPGTASLQPWLSLENLTMLVATLLWAWNCFELKLSVEQRELLISGFLGVLGLIAVVSIFQGLDLQRYLPPILREAGQFANRNHTGDVLVMGGMLSFSRGLGALSRRKQAAALWIGLTLLFITAVILNNSRAGLILFGLGLLLSYTLVGRARHHQWSGWLSILAVSVIGLVVFAFVGETLQERFLTAALGHEGRLAIYQDSFSMILHDPWNGVGLANFDGVFNTQRIASAVQETRCLHPESDWLWLAAELGLGGVAILALMIAMTFRNYLRESPFSSLTKTSAIIAILFLLHSIVDVSGHCLGAVWSCIYLVGLGAFRTASPKDGKLPGPVLRLAGLALIIIALLRIQSLVGAQPWMPNRGAIVSELETLRINHSIAEQKNILSRIITWDPLDWYLYFQRGLVSKLAGDPIQSSEADFTRALFLDQTFTQIPRAIGDACRGNDPQEAIVAWKDLLRRARTPERKADFLNYILENETDDESRLGLADLAGDSLDLQAVATFWQSPPNFNWLRQNFIDTDPTLKDVAPYHARLLFDRWLERGNAQDLIEEWPYHPQWQIPGWKAYAQALAATGRFQDAVAAGLKYITPPSIPTSPAHQNVDEALRQHLANPKDPFPGVLLYFAQIADGRTDDALQTLIQVAQLPNRPAYVPYLLAKSLYDEGRYDEAWRAFTPLLATP